MHQLKAFLELVLKARRRHTVGFSSEAGGPRPKASELPIKDGMAWKGTCGAPFKSFRGIIGVDIDVAVDVDIDR